MKKLLLFILVATFVFKTTATRAQDTNPVKAGNVFYVNLPDWLRKTRGLNTAATLQYKNAVKEVYGFVVEDTKENLALDEVQVSSINEFYENFVNAFVKIKEKLNGLKPKYLKKGEISFIECEFSTEASEAMPAIYYLVGIVETKSSYYKVISWTLAENKEKYKQDLQRILYSVRD
jgi:hypothetical protein